MEKALTAFGTFWNFILWKRFYQLAGNKNGINHTTLGCTWVYTLTFDMYLSSSGIEALILQLPYMATVHGISPLSTKLLYIKLMWPLTYLLIRSEGNTDLPMLYLRVCQKVLHSRYDLSYPRLVICS